VTRRASPFAIGDSDQRVIRDERTPTAATSIGERSFSDPAPPSLGRIVGFGHALSDPAAAGCFGGQFSLKAEVVVCRGVGEATGQSRSSKICYRFGPSDGRSRMDTSERPCTIINQFASTDDHI
jgi:hypothetical protein